MKKTIIILFLIVSGIVNAQSFRLANSEDQAHLIDMVGGDNMHVSSITFTDQNIEREWFYVSYTQGVPILNNYERFTDVYEKKSDGFIKINMPGLETLTHGPAAFAFLNNDHLPDLVQTGRDINNYPRTYVYVNDGNTSWKQTQELYGLFDGGIARIPDPDGDGVVIMGSGFDGKITSNTKILKNSGTGDGYLTEVFDGIGGVDGSVHMVDIMGGTDVVANFHGTNFKGSFNKKAIRQPDGTYTAVDNGLPALGDGDSEYFDLDNDGDPDWACTGTIKSFPGAPRLTLIYENNNGVFTEKYRFPAGFGMKLAVIDLDVDGYKGLAVMGSGWAGHEHHIAMYTNTEGVFNEWTDHPFHSESTMPQPSWGNGFNGGEFIVTDMNSDGKMDLIIVGRTTDSGSGWGNYKALYFENTTNKQPLSTENLQLEQVTLYPNPTRGKISLKLPSGDELDKFMVYDSTGRNIGQSTNGTNYFDMQPYATGFYYLRYQTISGKTGKIKFLKQ